MDPHFMPAQFGVQHHTWSRAQISAEHYGCHFDDLTVDRSHLYDNDNIKTSWSEVYAAFDGERGGRQGCGLDLAPFWYTSPFKLCAPFHLISPLSVGFPRNSFLSLERYVTLACYVRVHSNYKHHFDRIFHCSPT